MNYPLHTGYRRGCSLLGEDSTTNFYAQELRYLLEQQEGAASSSLKTLHCFIDKEDLPRVRGSLQQSTLPYQH